VTFTERYKQYSQSRPWRARVLVVFLSLIIALSLVRISLPFVISYSATSWLESEGVNANIGGIEISLIGGSFSIIDAAGKNHEGKGFTLGRLDIAWQWQPLFNRTIIVDTIEISSLSLDLLLYDNGAMNIAGLAIKKTGDEIQAGAAESATTAPWDIVLKSIVFSDINPCLQNFDSGLKLVVDYCGKLAKFDWQGDISFKPSSQLPTTDLPLYVKGTLGINDITLHNNHLKRDLLNVDTIAVNQIDIETSANININNIGITKLAALHQAAPTSVNDRYLLAFDNLNITPLNFRQSRQLSIGTIDLQGTSVYLAINDAGEMNFKAWVPDVQKGPSGSEQEEPGVISDPFVFALEEFKFTTRQHIIFVDNSLKEHFTADIHDIDLRLEQFNTAAPEKSSHIVLGLAIGKHGRFKLDSNVSDFTGRPVINGAGEIAGFDLKMFAPLTKQYIGHNIKSGQLDVDLKIKVDKGIIDSKMGLALHQLELKTLSKEEAEKINSEFGLPLNSSLSLLRDKNNTISLDIPVTGDIENPEFNPRDAIVTATSKAISTAVIHYYTPFGLILAAGALFDLATALRFDPVLFEAGKSELTSAHEEQLGKLASLMIERPGIHLTLCGISNSADIATLFPELLQDIDTSRKQQIDTVPVSDQTLAVLKQLAESRSSNVKNYIVGEKGAAASRLIECDPEYSAAEISGVNISI